MVFTLVQYLFDHSIVGSVLVTITLYHVLCAIRNIYLSPLSRFPGPKLAAASKIYDLYYTIRGHQHHHYAALHEKYGEVIRVGPKTLSFISDTAWRDIYMARPQMEKATRTRPLNGVYNLINAPSDVHARQRKVLSHAFSERTLREQEPLIKTYVDVLVKNLREDAEAERPVDMVAYFHYLTFDLVADMALASPFDALRNRKEHPWMATFFGTIIRGTVVPKLLAFPLLVPFVALFSGSLRRTGREMFDHTRERVAARIAAGNHRPDFMAHVLDNNDFEDAKRGLTRAEIDLNFNTIMVAGSETVATLLSGCMALLASNKTAAEKLKKEVRNAFANVDGITAVNVNKLPYLLAVIEEALRLYPPVPVALNRQTPPKGATISGHWVPGNTIVGIPQLAASRSPINFTSPNTFIPERFLPDPDAKFASDRRAALQPFSAGPRNCIGRGLAYVEMKLVLARIVYEFDFEVVEGGEDWFEQDAFVVWVKRPLVVRVSGRVG